MARVVLEGANLTNVWRETWERDGRQYESRKALVNVVGEAPMQFSVLQEDYEEISSCIGATGDMELLIDATPGNRIRIFVKGLL